MILSQHVVKGTTTPVTICPLGDIQWAGRESDLAFDHIQAHIERCLSLPNPLFIGMGDYVDFASPSNREALAKAPIYDTARRVVDDAAKALADEVYEKILKPTRGKWLGLLSGHHYYPLKSGGTTDMYLASKLDAEFLDVCAVINLTFTDKTHHQSILLYTHHGCGDSVFPHGPLNKLYRVAPNWGVDIFLMGHQTKKAVGEFDYIEAVFPHKGKPHLSHKTRHLVGTGGWTKGYQDGQTTYVERGMLPPVALGQPLIHVRPVWRRSQTVGGQVWDSKVTVEV